MKSWFWPQITVKTEKKKERSSQNEKLISTPNYGENKKKVFTELKADFARNWLTQDISLSKNDV